MRFLIRDLSPDQAYVLQMRYKNADATSEWSRKFRFTTVTDERIPNVPGNVTWITKRAGFHADWDRVTTNTNGTPATIKRYEVELVAPGGARKVKGITPQTDEQPHYDLSAAGNEALFGDVKSTLTFRVRAVNMSENKSAWSAAITASFPTPNAPTNVTWVRAEDAFVGRWTEVTKNTDNTNCVVIRYEAEVSADGVRKVIGITRQTDNDPSVDQTSLHLSRAENRAIFGTYKRTVAFRVRAVNAAEQKSAWSSSISRDMGTPVGPGNVTWTSTIDALHGEWDAVAADTDATSARIRNYDVEVSVGAATKMFTVPARPTGRHIFDFSLAANIAAFGSVQSTVGFRVRAVSIADVEGAWSTLITTTFGAPAAPGNLVVTGTTEGLQVNWDAPADPSNVAGYRVYIDTVSGFTPSAVTRVYDGAATNFNYNTLTMAVHYVIVRSVSHVGVESASLSGTGTPKSPFIVDGTAPTLPGALTATLDRTGAVAKANLTWTFTATGNDADINAFVVRWRKVGESASLYRSEFFSKDARSGSIDLPQAFNNYEFQIAAVDATANYSTYSATVTITGAVAGAPPQTVGVTAAGSLDGLQISWTESTALDVINGGYYRVQLARDTGFTTGLLTYTTGNTTISVNGLPANTTYYVRVQAIDVAGETGTYSATATTATTAFPVTALSDGVAPSVPGTPVLSAGIGYLYATWPAVTTPSTTNSINNGVQQDPVTYEVHMATTVAGTYSKIAEVSGTTMTIDRDSAGASLVYAQAYFVKVLAKDRDGASVLGAASNSAAPMKAALVDISATLSDFGGITPGAVDSKIGTFQTGTFDPAISNLQTQVNNPPGAVNYIRASRTLVHADYAALVAGTTVSQVNVAGPVPNVSQTFPTVSVTRLVSTANLGYRVREVRYGTGPYNLSFWARTVTGTKSVNFDINDGVLGTANLTTSWQKFSFTATSPQNISATYNFFDIESVGATDIYIYQPMLESGSKASAYQPSPEEMQTDINTTSSASAAGVVRVYNSTTIPTGTADGSGRIYVIGDTTFVRGDTAQPTRITGQYEYTANNTWTSRTLSHQIISSIDVGNMTILGQLQAANINASSLTIQQSQVPNLATSLSQASTDGSNSAQVALKTLWGGSANATTINGGVIATNTILTQAIAIADYTNYVADPYFESTNNPNGLGAGARYLSTASNVPVGAPYPQVWGFNVTAPFDIFTNYYIPVKAGEQFYMESWAANNGGATGTLIGVRLWSTDRTAFEFQQATGAPTSSLGVTSTWTKMQGTYAVPATVGGKPVGFIQLWLRPANTTGWYYTGWLARRRNGGELIVDGAISANKVSAGTYTGGEFIIGAGGILKTAGSEVTITSTGITVTAAATGGISASKLTTGTFGTGEALTINGNMTLNGNQTIAGSGYITSSVYRGAGDASPTGYRLSTAGLDIRSGTIAVGTLIGGTISSADIRLGVNGILQIDDASAYIQSNNYNATNQTGWRLGNGGLTFYGASGFINAANISGDTVSGRTMTVTQSISSSNWNGSSTGWSLGSTGLTIYNGTVSASAITTGQLTSTATTTLGGTTQNAWSINLNGSATFSDMYVRGRVLVGPSVGSSDSSYMQSSNYSTTQGWRINSNGTAEFYGVTVKGTLSGSTVAGTDGLLVGSMSTPRINLKTDTNGGLIEMFTNTVGESAGKINPEISLVGGVNRLMLYLVAPKKSGEKATFIKLVSAPAGSDSMVLEAANIDFNLDGGTFRMASTSNCPARLGRRDVGTAFAFHETAISVVPNSFNNTQASIGSTNTLDFMAREIHAQTGLWDDSLAGAAAATGATIGTSGRIVRTSTSLRKFKKDIQLITYDSVKNILELEPVSFAWTEDSPHGEDGARYNGFIAEQAQELGIDEWLTFDKDGELSGIRYGELMIAHNILLKNQEDRIRVLEEKLEALLNK